MFEMFETYGKQITAFISEAKTLLEAIRVENAALKSELSEVRTQLTRVEVAIAALDFDAEEIAEEIAEEVIEETAVAEETPAPVIVEEIPTPEGEIAVIEQESVPPAIEEEKLAPIEEQSSNLPETPVPDEPSVEPEKLPEAKRKRIWI
jgi:hypothetical protein